MCFELSVSAHRKFAHKRVEEGEKLINFFCEVGEISIMCICAGGIAFINSLQTDVGNLGAGLVGFR